MAMACLKQYFDDPATAGVRYEAIRKERIRKSHENRKQAFNTALANHEEAVVSVAEEWQQSLARERFDWLYTYDATAVQI
jgi:salicylate hydroxylase